jgi:branched-subunit amino acid ABC-type transport system permease component
VAEVQVVMADMPSQILEVPVAEQASTASAKMVYHNRHRSTIVTNMVAVADQLVVTPEILDLVDITHRVVVVMGAMAVALAVVVDNGGILQVPVAPVAPAALLVVILVAVAVAVVEKAEIQILRDREIPALLQTL